MDRERVIVYIDEETDDGMMWEELNQEGQMRVSVYDEEFESWSEYGHSIVVKSLQECLAEHYKQVRKEVVQEIWKEFSQRLMNKTKDMPVINVAHLINSVLDQIQGE